ncbi:sulfite exporter TauE/SafE family protein [Chitinophaga sp. YIM B06452]|uniref:sulfite exporter TauE/SafE family protein n=1 Tax=Chitinophaga sp. YIM B06452 TaxID=3082158 RepID=UPI0031FE4995
MNIVLPAVILGFLGSFHCIGMCGPIALTLPVQQFKGARKLSGILLYNTGRVTAYMLMGTLFGWIGRQFYIGGLQQWLSVSLGVLLLGTLFFQRYLPAPGMAFVRAQLGKLLSRPRFSTLYAIGFLNGFLPCGLVYMAIAGALAAGSIVDGALFMAAFGAGTLPAMMAVTWFSQLISMPVRHRIRQAIPLVVGVMAMLLILRGMNLGIPYISPVMTPEQPQQTHQHCH